MLEVLMTLLLQQNMNQHMVQNFGVEGVSIEEAQELARKTSNTLRPEDRCNVIPYSQPVKGWADFFLAHSELYKKQLSNTSIISNAPKGTRKISINITAYHVDTSGREMQGSEISNVNNAGLFPCTTIENKAEGNVRISYGPRFQINNFLPLIPRILNSSNWQFHAFFRSLLPFPVSYNGMPQDGSFPADDDMSRWLVTTIGSDRIPLVPYVSVATNLSNPIFVPALYRRRVPVTLTAFQVIQERNGRLFIQPIHYDVWMEHSGILCPHDRGGYISGNDVDLFLGVVPIERVRFVIDLFYRSGLGHSPVKPGAVATPAFEITQDSADQTIKSFCNRTVQHTDTQNSILDRAFGHNVTVNLANIIQRIIDINESDIRNYY